MRSGLGLVAAAAWVVAGCGGGAPQASFPDGGTTPAEEAGAGQDAAPPGDAGATGLHVEGNRLMDRGGPVRLLGVNHSGAEYACVQGYGIVEGPSDDSLALPMLTWKINTVRLPLNEQCWLGINGIDPKYSGAAYRDAIAAQVATLRAHGLYVVLDLHWAAPGAHVPKEQQPMADADHAPAFWQSVAARFKDDAGVVFDVFNEPYIDTSNASTQDPWACLRDGCTIIKGQNLGGSYASAGTQSLVDAIRATGATNVIMVPGLAYSSDLSGWLAHQPKDPLGQIAASLHLYNFNGCTDAACFTSRYEAVAKAVPLVTGENGENDCGHTFIDAYMTWADARGVSYLGWTWNVWDCASGPALITAYDGTPTAFGAGLKQHLLGL